MQLNYRRHKGVALKIHWAQQSVKAHQSVWMGMMFLSVLFRQVYKKDIIYNSRTWWVPYLFTAFRALLIQTGLHWDHRKRINLSWTQNYWRVTVKQVSMCGKSPRLHNLCVTLTLVPLPMSDDDYRSDPNQNNIPSAERW